jgi:hypothetical protein
MFLRIAADRESDFGAFLDAYPASSLALWQYGFRPKKHSKSTSDPSEIGIARGSSSAEHGQLGLRWRSRS